MKNVRFVVKVNRGGARAPSYVQRVDPAPIQMTTNRKLALLMGRFTAEDAVKSLQNSQVGRNWSPSTTVFDLWGPAEADHRA